MAQIDWYRVASPDDLEEGDIKTVLAGRNVVVLTLHEGRFGALDNRCPHENAPLGEGYIDRGWLICPLHNYEFDPHDGHPSPTYEEGPPAHPVEVRDDGVYVGIEDFPASYEEARRAFLAATEDAIALVDATPGARQALIDWRRAAVVGTEVEPPENMPRTVQAADLPDALALARALRAWHDSYEAMRVAFNRIPREERPSVARPPEKYPAPAPSSVPRMTFG
ncbi:MAG: Rieske (2Fe-2S) protein [Chloroflexi bacterium]|nr:Rieske (2Fe-2S) protein [Chloroflexota bacterium]